MRSVYAKILAWSLVTLFISMGVFFLVSKQIEIRLGAGELFRGVQKLELEQAVQAYESGGRAGAADFISRIDRATNWKNYALDSSNRDLSTGADRSALTARLKGRWDQPVPSRDGLIFGMRSPDRRYTLIVEAPITFEPWTLLIFNGLILLTVAVLSWPLAFHIGSPLRSLSRIVERFGQGDLSIRVKSSRRDEIGELARSFDRMADRIETLMTAERRLLQDVSHELRSPLARLSFAAELVATEPDRDKAVTRIRKEVSRLSALIGSLLQMTRAEGDPESGQRKEFSLGALIRDLVDDCAVEAAARGSRLVCACAEDIPVAGDPELIRRAVENVLRNAIHHSPEGEPVDVRVTAENGAVLIEVGDRGPGVPEEELTRIFHPFYRVDDSRTASTGGVGLGLAIAMRAVKLHNGSIGAKNLHPGLLVMIRIPLS